MLYVTPDLKQIYTTNVSSATVSILEKVTLPPMGPPPGCGHLRAACSLRRAQCRRTHGSLGWIGRRP